MTSCTVQLREPIEGDFESMVPMMADPVASRMATLMETRIGVRSWVGQGSVFSVELPRVASRLSLAARPNRVVETDGTSDLSGLSVLCIDDEQLIIDGMRALLEHWGCRVHTAQSLDVAAEILRADPIQAVFADYQLKEDQTGLDFLIEARKDAPDLHVALLTAEGTGDVLARAQAVGIMLLRKPADPAEIRQFLSDFGSQKAPYAAE